MAGEALEQSASLSYHVLTRLSLSLAREPVQAQGLIESEESAPIEKLAREGKRIIEARCGLQNYDLLESEMPRLHLVEHAERIGAMLIASEETASHKARGIGSLAFPSVSSSRDRRNSF